MPNWGVLGTAGPPVGPLSAKRHGRYRCAPSRGLVTHGCVVRTSNTACGPWLIARVPLCGTPTCRTENKARPKGCASLSGGHPTSRRPGSVQIAPELVGEGMVPELVEGLGLDLADAFPGHAEDAAYVLQGAGAAVSQAVAELDDLA